MSEGGSDRALNVAGGVAVSYGPVKRRKHAPRPKERVSDGIRTRDRLDHNQELYQLSYAHRASVNLAGRLRSEAR